MKIKSVCDIYNFLARKYILTALKYMANLLYVKHIFANISNFYAENIYEIYYNHRTIFENIFYIFRHTCYIYIFPRGVTLFETGFEPGTFEFPIPIYL